MQTLRRSVVLIGLVVCVVSPAAAVTLTSLTLEKSTAQGAWLNAPGGIWSSNLADPLAQLGVRQNGVFLNTPGNGLDLGEISIDLAPGLNTFELFGTSPYRNNDYYYGLALFFDHTASPPQMAVYNSNGSPNPFSITLAGTTISGSANGGLFPDIAPGSATYKAADGSIVQLVGFNVLDNAANADIISWGNIAPDGYSDAYAVLKLNFTPVPDPVSSLLLMGISIVGLAGFGRARRNWIKGGCP